MAPYATRAELVSLGISAAALTNIPTDDQEVALEAASRVADSYLTKRFTLPLTVWGDDLKQAVCDVAAYRLMKARGFNPQRSDADQLRDSYTDAMKWFRDVSEGKATPVNVVDSSAGPNNTDAAGDARRRAFVLQASSDAVDSEDFWGHTRSRSTDGTPFKRGW